MWKSRFIYCNDTTTLEDEDENEIKIEKEMETNYTNNKFALDFGTISEEYLSTITFSRK
jgi:hypothetical protein